MSHAQTFFYRKFKKLIFLKKFLENNFKYSAFSNFSFGPFHFEYLDCFENHQFKAFSQLFIARSVSDFYNGQNNYSLNSSKSSH